MFAFSAMERAATPGNIMETQIVVAAIASGLVGVTIAAMLIYLCCFNQRRNRFSKTEIMPGNNDNKMENSIADQRNTPRRKYSDHKVLDKNLRRFNENVLKCHFAQNVS